MMMMMKAVLRKIVQMCF